ncbi:hypothetical protein ICA16_27060 [Pseudomonas anatoliensis]|uniref:hypothetical protein n=1 Tax=Pseudomonas anatoliensis TaxID=2710589 RepID=UPI001B3363CC|nr:hypothetical protein [Pseudomonas anatoliensis]MBP5959343.1 hypothetical protein [Pseudomonas anatoliensis]
MTKKYLAHIIEIDPYVEDLIVLRVNDVTFRGFASYCPFVVDVGKTYEVELEMVLPEELAISKIENEEERIEMLGNGFSCEIHGRLEGDIFKSFVEFSDQGLHYDYPHLNEQFVKITAERIDVSF